MEELNTLLKQREELREEYRSVVCPNRKWHIEAEGRMLNLRIDGMRKRGIKSLEEQAEELKW